MLRKFKAVVATVAVASVALLGGCASKSDDASFVGDWKLVAMESENEEDSVSAEDLALMEEMGLSISLEVKEDGKASMTMFDEPMEGTWKADGKNLTFTFEGESLPGTLEGDELSFTQDDMRMVFKKTDAAASDDSDSGVVVEEEVAEE